MHNNKIYPILPIYTKENNHDDYFYNIWCGVIYGLCFCICTCILLAVFLIIFTKNKEINDFSGST